jgi:hypothetical protein
LSRFATSISAGGKVEGISEVSQVARLSDWAWKMQGSALMMLLCERRRRKLEVMAVERNMSGREVPSGKRNERIAKQGQPTHRRHLPFFIYSDCYRISSQSGHARNDCSMATTKQRTTLEAVVTDPMRQGSCVVDPSIHRPSSGPIRLGTEIKENQGPSMEMVKKWGYSDTTTIDNPLV